MVKIYDKKWEYIVVLSAFGAWGFGFGTGANDVANAFGTSIGSGALTNRQAVMIAAVFEFTGALVLGRVSTSTIAKGIADYDVFKPHPFVYAYGMMWVLLVGTAWLLGTTYYGLNVSSTHSIIGGIMGFALSYRSDGVLWIKDDPDSIPPFKGVVPIVVAWFFAPTATATGSASLFLLVRTFVMRSENSYNRSFYVLPGLVLLTAFINVYFVLTKGAAKTFAKEGEDFDENKAAWIAIVVAACTAAASVLILPFVRKRAEQLSEDLAAEKAQKEIDENKPAALDEEGNPIPKEETPSGVMTLYNSKIDSFESLRDTLLKANRNSIKAQNEFMVDLPTRVQVIHDRAERFDPKTEDVFKVLQVFSACCVTFAHGAGEVGYMAGPLSVAWSVYQNGELPKKVVADLWVLIFSALSLVFGLALYGQKVTRAMGAEISCITASRGFAAELSTACVIMIAAQYGLPTSSSQCITGGILGIGLVEGVSTGVNWVRFGHQFISWVATIFVMALGTAAFFAQGIAAPT
mmetsp:Transcript_15258/g.15398  ORF Transcript_15258/g.15398 Transcript_15258/m.15398 type:complete len:520 (+) Transcript_15258:46-1605(+)